MIGLSPNFTVVINAYRATHGAKIQWQPPELTFVTGCIPFIGTPVGFYHLSVGLIDVIHGLAITLFKQQDGWQLVKNGLQSIIVAPIEVMPGINALLLFYYAGKYWAESAVVAKLARNIMKQEETVNKITFVDTVRAPANWVPNYWWSPTSQLV